MPTKPLAVVVETVAQRLPLVAALRAQGFRVAGFDGGAGLRRLLDRPPADLVLPDLVMLGLRLPDEDGYALARHVRGRGPHIGILLLADDAAAIDAALVLDCGADDCVATPIQPRALLDQVRQVLRRARSGTVPAAPARVRMGRRVLDLDRGVLLDAAGSGAAERLTHSEFHMLRLFAAHPHRPLERDWLMEATSRRGRSAIDRAIDLRITRLRRKIEHDPAAPLALRTIRGVGYMFVPDGD